MSSLNFQITAAAAVFEKTFGRTPAAEYFFFKQINLFEKGWVSGETEGGGAGIVWEFTKK